MRPKVNMWINWSKEELNKLVNQNNACVFKETIQKHIALYPIHKNNVKKSIEDILNSSINAFDRSFNGLLISYQDVKIVSKYGRIFNDNPHIHVDIQADFYIFRPTVDSILTGIVNKKETNYIGVLIHKIFNVSVTKRSNDECWLGHNVIVGDRVTFRVTIVDLKAKVPFIRGELLSSETPEDDDQMDIAEEEINEEGGTERDSGYQESENETKPSKFQAIPTSLAGASSTIESKERERKPKKKKIKSPEKILQVKNQEMREIPVHLPTKVSKKRKHDDDVSPKKETQNKVKRLKVEEQVNKGDEHGTMQKELSAGPHQSAHSSSDKPRIINDEVLLSRSVNIKMDEDQSSQLSRISSQETDDENDDDDIPRDHSQLFGQRGSPIPTSDDELEVPRVKESVDKSPKKKLENNDEKKSNKKKAQNVTNSQEDQLQSHEIYSQEEQDDDNDDDDIPRDHSQRFGHRESPIPTSDDEPELPKAKESVKSPQKKLENNDDKKSKKKKAQNVTKIIEDQSQFSRVYSHEREEDEDIPRDHSQVFHEELPTPDRDDELEIPRVKVVEPVAKKPKKKLDEEPQEKIQSETLSSEKIIEKKVQQKKPTKKKETDNLSHEEQAARIERLRNLYAESIDRAIIKMCAGNYDEEEVEEYTNYEFLEDLSEEQLNLEAAEKKKESKFKENKKAKPLGNSTVIESQLGSPDFVRVQEPSVSPVIPEIKKSKTRNVIEPQELQLSDNNVKSFEDTDAVIKKAKKSKKSKERASEVDTQVSFLASEPAMPLSDVRVNEEPMTKNSKTTETIKPKNIETTMVNGSLLATPEKNSEIQESEISTEKPKKSKKSSKEIVQEEKNPEKAERNSMMTAIDKVLTSASKNSMILGGFSDSDDDLPDQPILLSSVKLEKNNEELVNGVMKKSKKSKKSKNKDPDSSTNQTAEELNLVNESVMIDTSRVKEENKKEKKKKKVNETAVPEIDSVIKSESIHLNNQTVEELNSVNENVVIDPSTIKEEKRKKKKKKVSEINSTIGSESILLNNQTVEELNSVNESVLIDTSRIKEEKKKKKKKVAETSAAEINSMIGSESILLNNQTIEELNSVNESMLIDTSRIKEEKKKKKKKVSETSASEINSMIGSESILLNNQTVEELNSVNESVVIDTSRIKEEKKKKKKKVSETNSVIESESILLNNTEVIVDTSIVKQESKKKKKKKSMDSIANPIGNSTINDSQIDSFSLDSSRLQGVENSSEVRTKIKTLMKIKDEPASDAEGPAAKKKIKKLVFTE